MKRFQTFVMLVAAAVLMAACGDDSFRPQAQPQYQQAPAQTDGSHAAAPAPVQQQQVHQQDNGIQWGSVAAGAVGGYLLGKALEPSAPPPQQTREVVRETRYITRTVPAQPSPAVTPAAKPPAAPAFTAPPAPAPTPPAAPKPNVVVPKFTPPPPATTKFSGPSSYSSVSQSKPSYSTPSYSSSRSSSSSSSSSRR